MTRRQRPRRTAALWASQRAAAPVPSQGRWSIVADMVCLSNRGPCPRRHGSPRAELCLGLKATVHRRWGLNAWMSNQCPAQHAHRRPDGSHHSSATDG
jgi:hypothetical protein